MMLGLVNEYASRRILVQTKLCNELPRYILCGRRLLHLSKHFVQGTRDELTLSERVPLAGRKFMPSSHACAMPQYLCSPSEEKDYPLILKARNNAVDINTPKEWSERCRDVINEAYSEFERGGSPVALLFRGLPIHNAQDFSIWAKNLGYASVLYGQATGNLSDVAENVSGGSTDTNLYTIEPHNEQAYSEFHPTIFTMCSLQRARKGGETAIADASRVFSKLDKNFVEKCEKQLLRYWQFLPHKNSRHCNNDYGNWQLHFGLDDRLQVEEFLRERSYSFEWENGNLFLWKNLPAFKNHPKTGQRLWFNQISANHCSYLQAMPMFEGVQLPKNIEYIHHTTYGDGEEMDQHDIDMLRCAQWQSAVGFEWRNGDVLFMDNMIMQHSRLSFEGERRVGISLLTY